jgi:hypothetical protein
MRRFLRNLLVISALVGATGVLRVVLGLVLRFGGVVTLIVAITLALTAAYTALEER